MILSANHVHPTVKETVYEKALTFLSIGLFVDPYNCCLWVNRLSKQIASRRNEQTVCAVA